MIYCIEADNGQLVGCCAAEIVSVPYYELIDQNLEKANIRIYRTDKMGEIEIKTNGKEIKINEFLKCK